LKLPAETHPIPTMRILFLHQHFPPETVGTSTRAGEIVEWLTARGHEVTVVTGIPCHPSTMRSGEVSRRQAREETWRGARVIRVWAYGTAAPDTTWRRLLTYGSFMVLGGLRAALLRGPFDALVAVSPLPNGIAGQWVSQLRGWPLFFDVCDIWPDVAVAVGMVREGLFLRMARWLESRVYRRSKSIGVVTPGFTTNLVAKGVPESRVRLLPDWVMPDRYDPAFAKRDETRREFQLNGRFVAAFLGNFGRIMGLGALLDMAVILQQRAPEVLVLFVGKGVEQPMIEERIARDGLQNVRIIPYQPRHRVPDLLAAADALLVTYCPDPITRITVPSKIYEYMSMARPVVAGCEGVLATILEEAGCAEVVEDRNPERLAEAVLALKADPERAARMGEAGRYYAMDHFCFQKVAADYEQTIAETALQGSVIHRS
jgi:glycosyltransferase involved in cell wall biosynthesis